MTQRRSPQTVWHLILITLFGLPLVSPLLRWTAVPCTHDGHLHYHRIAAMRHAWENGLPFTRWLPDLAFGYGYPFFIYREPVPLYAGLIPHLLGLPLPAAENLVYIMAILAGGWFMYLWARDILGARAGLVTAVAYMAAPYILIDALIRGNSPESVALPLFPLLLWLGRHWLLTGTTKYFLLTVFSLALLSLSHNISLLIFTPTLAIYLLIVGRLHQLDWRPLLGRLALIFGLGLGMTAFYSGGALLEMGQVTLQQSTTTRNNDFHYNFTSLAEILAPVAPEDPTLVNPPLPFRVGWVPAALAILGLASLLWRKKEAKDLRLKTGNTHLASSLQSPISNQEQRWHIIMMAVATAVFLLLSLPITLPIWENIPLIDFLQFPWRMVGRAALPIAFLAGVPFASLQVGKFASSEQRMSRVTHHVLRFTFYASLPLLILEAIPMLYPPTCTEASFPTINTVHGYEHFSGLVGVDPEGSYFPRTVARRPTESALEAAYQVGATPYRFDESVLPDGATVLAVETKPLATTIHLTSPEPFIARYLSFDFPGWTAVIDGRSTPITPSAPDGLITFPVPAGEHTIVVRWQSTPLRTALLGLSIMAMAGIAVTAVILADSRRGGTARYSLGHDKRLLPHAVSPSSARNGLDDNKQPSPRAVPSDLGRRFGRDDRETTPSARPKLFPVVPSLLIALVLIGFKFLIVDKMETPLRRVGTPMVDYPAALQAAEMRFDGYNLSQTSVESGSTFDIDLAWTAVSPPTANYQSNIWLAGSDGLVWSAKGTERPRLYETAPRTTHWLPTQWAWDSREIQVLSGTPPGQYDIILTLFDKADLQPRNLLAVDGTLVGTTAVIGQITVTRPDEPAEFDPQYQISQPVAALTLLGYNQDRTEAAPGDPVLLTLFWEKPALPPSALSIFNISLQDETGVVQLTWPITPARADYPPHDWLPNEHLRGQYLLRLPASLDSGGYQFLLNSVPLGQITIHAPDRLFEQPEVETAVNIPFSNSDSVPLAKLTGYTAQTCHLPLAEEAKVPCHLHLIWQAVAEIPISYRVFVHLVDENSLILAQSDGEPANWSHPTTGWAIGEYILDPHALVLPGPLPDGPLTLRIGLYDPVTGQRLRTPTSDFAELTIE